MKSIKIKNNFFQILNRKIKIREITIPTNHKINLKLKIRIKRAIKIKSSDNPGVNN